MKSRAAQVIKCNDAAREARARRRERVRHLPVLTPPCFRRPAGVRAAVGGGKDDGAHVHLRPGAAAARARNGSRFSQAAPRQVFGPAAGQQELYDEAIVPIVDEARRRRLPSRLAPPRA